MDSMTAAGRAGYSDGGKVMGAGYANATSVKSSEINDLCDRNNDMLKELHGTIEHLASRLTPVMHTVPENGAKEGRDIPGFSTSLGQTLGVQNDMIRVACAKLRSLADRLEI